MIMHIYKSSHFLEPDSEQMLCGHMHLLLYDINLVWQF